MAKPDELTPLHKTAKPDLWYLRSPVNTWTSLVLLAIGCSFAQGPLVSFQILEPAMLNDGIFQCHNESVAFATEKLDEINSFGLCEA